MIKSWYSIKLKSQTRGPEAELLIMGDIGGWGVTPQQFREDLKRVGKTDLHVHINSDGGDIFAGNEIYNALNEHEGFVRVTVGALAASMASVIAMAGDAITIASNGMLMIHNP